MEVEKCILKMLKLGLVDLRAARSSTNFPTWLSILTQTFHQLYVCQRKRSNKAINMTHIWNKTLCVPTGLKVCVPSPEVEQSHPPHCKRVSVGFHQPRSKPIDQLTPFRIQPLMINITVAAGSGREIAVKPVCRRKTRTCLSHCGLSITSPTPRHPINITGCLGGRGAVSDGCP